MTDQSAHLDMTADIVAAYVSNNTVRASELPELIASIHASLAGIGSPKPIEAAAPELKPAVSIKKSITDEYLICLDDGKKFKSLKRHLGQIGMTPDEYRTKWGLPRDYPMVAPGYAAKRSELAKASGLGSDRRKLPAADKSAEAQQEPQADEVSPEADAVPEAPRRRGRPKKVV